MGIKKRHDIFKELEREKNSKDEKESIEQFELNFKRMGFQTNDLKDPSLINDKFSWRNESAMDQFIRLKTINDNISYNKQCKSHIRSVHEKRRNDVLAYRERTVRERVNNVIQKNAQLQVDEENRITDLLNEVVINYKKERDTALEYQNKLYIKQSNYNKAIKATEEIVENRKKESEKYMEELINNSAKKREDSEADLQNFIENRKKLKELRDKVLFQLYLVKT